MASQKEWFEKDYYAVLGLEKTATQKEITKAYRALAKKFHPDANAGNLEMEAKFKEITNANEVLSDEEKTKEYDSIREMYASGYSGSGGSSGFGGDGFNFNSTPGMSDDISDLLSGLFSRVRKPGQTGSQQDRYQEDFQQQGGSSPYDVETELSLSFHQAIDGTTTNINYSLPGNKNISEVKVKIPPCVNDKQRIKVTGKGKPAPRGKNGDLYITINVGTHPWFTRSGKNLSIKIPISFPESIIGTNVKVPTLGNPVTVKVPPKTKSGKTLRVKERGIQVEGSPPGDLLVTFEIIDQPELSEIENSLYMQLIKAQSVNPRSKFGLEK